MTHEADVHMSRPTPFALDFSIGHERPVPGAAAAGRGLQLSPHAGTREVVAGAIVDQRTGRSEASKGQQRLAHRALRVRCSYG